MAEEYTDISSIIEKSVAGDPTAAGQLYEMHRSKGISIAMQYVKNRDDAEDMYQDSFLKALTNIDKFDTSKQFAPWLDTIIVNTCKNFLVKKRAVNFSEMSDEESEFVDTLDSKDNETMPELSYDRKEFMKIMDGLINELPQAQKEAVTLFYYKEMSIRQIAEYQNVPEDTVKSRLNYSRKKVGAAVEEYEKKTGIKLHGAILIPLMYLLFYKKPVYAAQAESVLSAGSSAAENAAWSSENASTSSGMTNTVQRTMYNAVVEETAETAMEVAEKSGLSLALKIVIPVIAAAVIGTAAYTAYTVINHSEDDEQIEAVEDDEIIVVKDTEVDNESPQADESVVEPNESENSDDEQDLQEEPQGRTNLEMADFTDELIDSINAKAKEDLRKDFYDFFNNDQNNTNGIVGVGPLSCERGVSGKITGEPELIRLEIASYQPRNTMLLYYKIPATTHFLAEYDDYSEEPVYMVLKYDDVSLLENGSLDFGDNGVSLITDKPQYMSNAKAEFYGDGWSFFSIIADKTNRDVDKRLMEYFKSRDYEPGTPFALYDMNGDGKHELIIRGGKAEELYPYIAEIVSITDEDTMSVRFSSEIDSFDPNSVIGSYINENNQIVFQFVENDPQHGTYANAYYIVYKINSEGYPEKLIKFSGSKDGSMSDLEKEYIMRSYMIMWENMYYSVAG